MVVEDAALMVDSPDPCRLDPSRATKRPADSDGSEILELPVLPLRGTVVFPLTVVPLAAAQPRSLAADR